MSYYDVNSILTDSQVRMPPGTRLHPLTRLPPCAAETSLYVRARCAWPGVSGRESRRKCASSIQSLYASFPPNMTLPRSKRGHASTSLCGWARCSLLGESCLPPPPIRAVPSLTCCIQSPTGNITLGHPGSAIVAVGTRDECLQS